MRLRRHYEGGGVSIRDDGGGGRARLTKCECRKEGGAVYEDASETRGVGLGSRSARWWGRGGRGFT